MNEYMRLVLLLFLVVISSFLLMPNKIQAQVIPTPVVYNLPYPGILPDHPLYTLKRIRDWILLKLTKDPVKKIEVRLLLSDKKLVMGEILWEKKKTDLAIAIFKESESDLLSSALLILQLKQDGQLPPGLADKVDLASQKHAEILNMVKLSGMIDSVKIEKFEEVIYLNSQAKEQLTSLQ